MSGAGQLFVQPSQISFAGTTHGVWQRGIPDPGIPLVPLSVPAVAGVATCKNLIAASPPTLLEAYEIYSISIGWAFLTSLAVPPPTTTVDIEVALLVNDRVVFTSIAETVASVSGLVLWGSGAATADLVNPLVLNARDRLGLRVGVQLSADVPAITPVFVLAGTQTAYNGAAFVVVPFESTISYSVIDLPGNRRL